MGTVNRQWLGRMIARARSGDLDFQCRVAGYYLRRQSKAHDRKAVPWLRMAADQGSAWAQYQLGLAFDHGLGARRDLPSAIHWYTEAASQGYNSEQLNLGIILANLPGKKRDLRKAVSLYRQAAAKGNRNACYNLRPVLRLGPRCAEQSRRQLPLAPSRRSSATTSRNALSGTATTRVRECAATPCSRLHGTERLLAQATCTRSSTSDSATGMETECREDALRR